MEARRSRVLGGSGGLSKYSNNNNISNKNADNNSNDIPPGPKSKGAEGAFSPFPPDKAKNTLVKTPQKRAPRVQALGLGALGALGFKI